MAAKESRTRQRLLPVANSDEVTEDWAATIRKGASTGMSGETDPDLEGGEIRVDKKLEGQAQDGKMTGPEPVDLLYIAPVQDNEESAGSYSKKSRLWTLVREAGRFRRKEPRRVPAGETSNGTLTAGNCGVRSQGCSSSDPTLL